MDVLCDLCRKPMVKKGTLMMSNTKFEVFKCSSCGADKKKAIGVVRQNPNF